MSTSVKPIRPYQLCYYGAIHVDPTVAIDVPDQHASYWSAHGWCSVVGSIGPGVDETQRVTISGSPGSGSFTLALDGHVTTALSAHPSLGDVVRALEALPNVGPGNVVGAKPGNWDYDITFVGELGGTDVSLMVPDYTALRPLGCTVTVTTIVGGSRSAPSAPAKATATPPRAPAKTAKQ